MVLKAKNKCIVKRWVRGGFLWEPRTHFPNEAITDWDPMCWDRQSSVQNASPRLSLSYEDTTIKHLTATQSSFVSLLYAPWPPRIPSTHKTLFLFANGSNMRTKEAPKGRSDYQREQPQQSHQPYTSSHNKATAATTRRHWAAMQAIPKRQITRWDRSGIIVGEL